MYVNTPTKYFLLPGYSLKVRLRVVIVVHFRLVKDYTQTHAFR